MPRLWTHPEPPPCGSQKDRDRRRMALRWMSDRMTGIARLSLGIYSGRCAARTGRQFLLRPLQTPQAISTDQRLSRRGEIILRVRA